ncbi:hypothetical protein U1Q18_039320 [Sarracenia purpurea var. burkii]
MQKAFKGGSGREERNVAVESTEDRGRDSHVSVRTRKMLLTIANDTRLVVKHAWGKKPSNRDRSHIHAQDLNMKEKKPWLPIPEKTVIDAENIDEE